MVLAGVALAGILAVLHSCLDLKATIGGSQYHHILYFLTPAMKPRMLMTVDKDMNLLPVSVRVGQAVDVVAQVRIAMYCVASDCLYVTLHAQSALHTMMVRTAHGKFKQHHPQCKPLSTAVAGCSQAEQPTRCQNVFVCLHCTSCV